ncbi:MAG: hypothetical protein U5K79_01965 [Cyclobacteriaceae bacterium]|nr:hypothetical protein [Cyclobacteriaceae bacterium]
MVLIWPEEKKGFRWAMDAPMALADMSICGTIYFIFRELFPDISHGWNKGLL